VRKSLIAFGFAAIVAAGRGEAQGPPIVAGDGWEAFLGVEYVGGHAKFGYKRPSLVLVLTDTTLSVYPCHDSFCSEPRGRGRWKSDSLIFQVRLDQITAVDQSSRVKAASMGSKILIGFLASDKNEEFVGIGFETETSAEAPVFRTRQAQAGAIDAKIRFRLKRLGRSIAPRDTALAR
jgi:hypothetical protein